MHQRKRHLGESYGVLTARDVIGVMVGSEEDWERIAEFVEGILRIKKVDIDAT